MGEETKVSMVLESPAMAKDWSEAFRSMLGRSTHVVGRVVGFRTVLTPTQLEMWARNQGVPIESWNVRQLNG